MGDQVAPLATDLRVTDPPFFFESLNYPAADLDYGNSIAIGKDRLIDELNWLAKACQPYLPAVVIVGHSQGAHVVLNALSTGNLVASENLTSGAKAMIKSVVLYGDPTFQPGQPYNAPGAGTGFGLIARSQQSMDALKTFRAWGWEVGATAQSWIPKIRSYCKIGDRYCQQGLGANADAIHNSYAGFTPVARQWIERALMDFN